MLSLQPLFEFLSETDNLPVQGNKFDCQLLQFIEHGEGFFLGEPGIQCFDCLVIVHPDPAVFALQVGQLDIIICGCLVYFYHFHRFVEKGGKDELRFGPDTRIFEEPLELDVLEFVQTESVIIRVEPGFLFGKTSASSFT